MATTAPEILQLQAINRRIVQLQTNSANCAHALVVVGNSAKTI